MESVKQKKKKKEEDQRHKEENATDIATRWCWRFYARKTSNVSELSSS